MPERESQFLKTKKAAEEKKEEIPIVSRQALYETVEEIEKKLKERGVDKEDIEAALLLMKQIAVLDRRIFPKNHANFNFALKERPLDNFAGFIRPKENTEERSYQIYIKDLAKSIEEFGHKEVSFFGPGRLLRWGQQFAAGWVVAAHEVRHRVQHDRPVRQFSPESAKLIADDILRSIIQFQKMMFEAREKIYRKEKRSEEFIKEKLGPKEFDAEVIERLIGHKLDEIPKRLGAGVDAADLNEFASIIQMSASEKENDE